MHRSLFIFIFGCSLAALTVSTALCADQAPAKRTSNALSQEEKDAGWKLLFDGESTKGWRNYKSKTISDGWKVSDGTLMHAGKAGDIVTEEQYDAFELVIEYKISKGGNSGLMYHVNEEMDTPWMSGPEVQIQDNVEGHDPQKSGWLYQLYPASKDTTKPAGEWNELRLVITSEKCEHFMNGEKYCEYVKGSDDWKKKVAASKFAAFKGFGEVKKGYISLQDHNDEVAFRNIRIRPISSR